MPKMMFWFKKTSSQVQENELLDQVALYCRYAGLANYEIGTEGRHHVIILHHEMGRKWSLFLSHIIVQVMKNTEDHSQI
jgi:hypothetical protein